MANWKKNLIENSSFNGLLLYKLVTYIYFNNDNTTPITEITYLLSHL